MALPLHNPFLAPPAPLTPQRLRRLRASGAVGRLGRAGRVGQGARRRFVASGLTTDPNVTGIRADGWSIDYTSPPTFNPISDPRYVVLSRQGYNSAGQATTHSEALVITQRVRQPSPNQGLLDASRCALSDYIYSTDTIVGVTNISSETSPKPIANWAMLDRRIVGNTLRLELVAFHRNARNREQVACVEFRATDGTNTVTQIVSVSSILGHPGDVFPVVGYACDLDITTLNPGAITANARVLPWIGGAASVHDSADNSPGALRREFVPQVFLKNVTLAANPVLIYVATSGGNDATGAVSTNPATAAASPCATLAGAINRAHTVNGSVDGVEVRLMAGTHASSMSAIIATRAQATGELRITRDPNAARSAVILQFGAGAAIRPRLGASGGWLRFEDITVSRQGTFQFSGEAGSHLRLWFDRVDFDNNNVSGQWLSNSNAGTSDAFTGVTFTNMSGLATDPLAPTNSLSGHVLMRGVTASLGGDQWEGWLLLGSHLTAASAASRWTGTTPRAHSGMIVAYNRFTSPSAATPVFDIGGNLDVAGVAFVQNLFEYTSASSNYVIRVAGDAATGNATHVVLMHNTMAGFNANGRVNLFYDDGPTPRTNKLHALKGNIFVQINTKGDVFRATESGGTDAPTRVGNWGYLYGVGCEGEFSQFIDANNGGLGTSFAQAYPGLRASIGTSNTTRNDPLFTNYQGTTSGPTAGAGGGTYTLQAGSPAFGRVLSPVLRFDFAGNERPTANDASGSLTQTVATAAPILLTAPTIQLIGPALNARRSVRVVQGTYQHSQGATYSYRWFVAGVPATTANATETVWAPDDVHVGATVQVEETITNAIGTLVTLSSPIGPVLAAPAVDHTAADQTALNTLLATAGGTLSGATIALAAGTYTNVEWRWAGGIRPIRVVPANDADRPIIDRSIVRNVHRVTFNRLRLVSTDWPSASGTALPSNATATPAVLFDGTTGRDIVFDDCDIYSGKRGVLGTPLDVTAVPEESACVLPVYGSNRRLASFTISEAFVGTTVADGTHSLQFRTEFGTPPGAAGTFTVSGGVITGTAVTNVGTADGSWTDTAGVGERSKHVTWTGHKPLVLAQPSGLGGSGTVENLTVTNCRFSDLCNAIKPGRVTGNLIVTNNTFDRIFMDRLAVGFMADRAPYKLTAAWNVLRRPIARTGFPMDPHVDEFQTWFSSPGLADAEWSQIFGNVIVVGNATGSSQGIFLTDSDYAYRYYAWEVVGNLVLSAEMANQINLHGHVNTLVYGNTAVRWDRLDAAKNVTAAGLRHDSHGPNAFIDNIVEAVNVTGGTVAQIGNTVLGLRGATIGYPTVFAAPDAKRTAVADVVADFTPTAGYASKGAVQTGFVDFVNRTIDWSRVPTWVSVPTVTGATPSALVTSARAPILGGPRAGRSWTPPAGVEWRLVERTGETGATAWSSSTGFLAPGRHLQLRATAPSGAGQSATHNLVMGDRTWAWTIQT